MRGTVRRIPVLALAAALAAAGAPPLTAAAEGDGARPPPLRDADAKTWGRAKKLLPIYLWAKGPGIRDVTRVDEVWRKEGHDALRLTKAQWRDLGSILRDGSPFTTEKSRGRTIRVATGEKGPDGTDETLPVRVSVTGEYEPGCGKSFPLVITLHGGPMKDLKEAEAAAGTQFSAWNGQLSVLKGIVAAPALTGERYGPRERRFLRNLVEELDRAYNVDRDRVLLTGHSWGGILTWHLGPPHADAFALLAPFVCAVNPGRPHLRNLRALPVYHVQGDRDIEWILRTGRERKEILDDLGYEHVYRELHGGHGLFGGELAPIARYLLDRPRRMYAPEIVRCDESGANDSDLWYWVRSPCRDFTARLDRAANAVQVDIEEEEFEVLLADEMLDLDRPIRVRRGARTVFEGKVERSLRFALDHVAETGDRGRVFAASVRVP